MRIIFLLIIAILNVSLQMSIPNVLDLTILPNTSVVLVICYAYLKSDVEAATFGLLVGLLQDILFSQVIGYYALIYFVVGFVMSHLLKHFMNSNIIPIVLLNFIGTFMYSIMVYLFTYFFRGKLQFFHYMYNITLFEALENVVVAIPIFYLLYFADERLKRREQRQTKYLTSFKPKNKF